MSAIHVRSKIEYWGNISDGFFGRNRGDKSDMLIVRLKRGGPNSTNNGKRLGRNKTRFYWPKKTAKNIGKLGGR